VSRIPDRFDVQASTFDRRAGLPDDAARAVAEATVAIAAIGSDDRVLELGAGTGQVGRYLAVAERISYVGIDSSAQMLEVFRGRLGASGNRRATLIAADANERWPAADGSVAVVFASRVAHLLDAAHLTRELRRVCRPGGAFLVGRVARDADSARSRLRRQRAALLREHGIAPAEGAQSTRRTLEALVAAGAARIEPQEVASWTVAQPVRDIISGFREVRPAGAEHVDDALLDGVLEDLAAWAARELGDLRTVMTWEERYVLEGVRL
jgi:ubiquinone/menaquinone biosynthesis C-methylase UbiE